MYRITAGNWRNNSTGPMQVVSGALGKEKVHFQAPYSAIIEREINLFLNWFNINNQLDPIIKSALAHLWFVTIHSFEDGNGRIVRALTDMLLARADASPQRFYNMSAQIRIERNEYYQILEKTQIGSLDVTNWLEWFLNCLMSALIASEEILAKVLFKHQFWNKNATIILNYREIRVLNKMLDSFDGKSNTSKWAKIAKCSPDTALRDIQDLIIKKILRKEPGGGRNTSYEING